MFGQITFVTCLIAIYGRLSIYLLIFVGGKYSILDRFCYAKFLEHSILAPIKTDSVENDSQPGILEENVLEENHILCVVIH